MPTPLRVDHTAAGMESGLRKLAGKIFLGLCLGLVALMAAGSSLGGQLGRFADGQWWVVRALAVLLPCLVVPFILQKNLRYYLDQGQVIIARHSHLQALAHDGWTLILMWPSLIIAALAFGRWVWLGSPGGDSSDSVIFTSAVAVGLAFWNVSWLLSETEYRADEEGLRLGLSKFAEWGSIDRVVLSGGAYWVFHHRVLSNPVATFAALSPEANSEWLRRLEENGIPLEKSGAGVNVGPLAVTGFIGAVLLLLAGLAVLWLTPWDGRWVAVGSTLVCLAAQLWFEKQRGIGAVTKISPAVDSESMKPGAEKAAGEPIPPVEPIAWPDEAPPGQSTANSIENK